jgi:magnesium chelatase subunit H
MSRDRAQALLESTLDVPRSGQPGLMQHILEAGIDTASAPAVRAAFVERVVLGRESLDAFWRNYYGKNAPANLQTIVDHGREILVRLEESGDELDVVVHALNGGYVLPGKGADPIRAGAAGLPSGRNIHSIDPWRLPSDAAMTRGVQMAEQLIAAHVAEHGSMPETVALTLWALDTIKSEGESIGVVLGLIGAEPVRDGQGKIYRFDLIPLNKLGRARVDVVLDISSIFRDNFQMQLDLIDDLVIRAAKSGEPADKNPIAAHVAAMQKKGQTFEAATARLFTQAPGEYGTGVDMVVDESQWDNRADLASIYVQRSGFAYGGKRGGEAAQATYRSLLGTVEHVFQAIDSVEYGLTDMQHYYGHSGAVQLAASFESGKNVSLSYAESFTGKTTLTKAKQMVSMEVRTKVLNPRWFEPLLAQGYAGATEIANRFTNVFGWGAVGDSVENWVFDGMAQTFILDEDVQRRFAAANPHAAKAAVQRLLEANGRGMWNCDPAMLAQLQQIYADLEDRLEGVVA